MTNAPLPLAKRTKQEIVEEFEKLQDQLEGLKSTTKTVHSQPALDLVERAKTRTPETIDKAFADFQSLLHLHLTDLRNSLLEKSSALQEAQQAIELSRRQLELQHHVALAAETLEDLVAEHAKRSHVFQAELAQKKQEFDEQMALKKKAWERESEEYEYQKKMKRERDQSETEEREKTLAMRESALRSQEQEISQMKKTIEQAPKELDAALAKREQEVAQRIQQQFAHERQLLEKETGAQIRLLELTVKNLEERLATQIAEAASSKQQAEEANAKAQTLAMKAIERPTTIVAPANPPSMAAAPYRERQGGNA